MYMAADNGLYQYAERDLIQMQSAVQPNGVNVLIQADFAQESSYHGARRYKLEEDSSAAITSTIIQELGSIDSGDPTTLNDFMKWGFSRYPSQRKMLIIWSHGDSWYKDSHSKWICTDDDSESFMSIANGDMKIAFKGCPKLDIVLLDACSMQTIEVLTELSPYSDYIVGSADEVPLTGFPYDSILPLFDRSVEEIVQTIPSIYTSSYEALGSQNPTYWGFPVTCSSVQTSLITYFNNALRQFVIDYRNDAKQLLAIRNQCYELNTMYAEIDVMEFLDKIQHSNLDASLVSASIELQDLWLQSIVAYSAIEYYNQIGTATIWFPKYRDQFDSLWRHYNKLKFADSQWLSLLNKAYGKDFIQPDPPVINKTEVLLNTMRIKLYQPIDPDPLSYMFELSNGNDVRTEVFVPDSHINPIFYYTHIDKPLYISVRAIDLSGNMSDADSLFVDYNSPSVEMYIAPNPISELNSAVIKYYLEEISNPVTKLSIYDVRGREVVSRDFYNAQNGENQISLIRLLGDKRLSSGVYIMRIKHGNRNMQKRFTIIR